MPDVIVDPNVGPVVPPAPENVPPPNPNEGKITIKVDGKDRAVTQEELVIAAQKGYSADEKFQKAAEITKTLKDRDITAQNFLFNPKPSEEDAEAFLRANGADDTFVAEFIEGMRKQQGGSQDPAPEKGATVPPKSKEKEGTEDNGEPREIKFEDFPEAVQKELQASSKRTQAETEEKYLKVLESDVDKSELVGTLLKEVPEGNHEGIKKSIVKLVFNGVHRKARDKGQYSPTMIDSALREAVKFIEDSGMLPKQGTYPSTGPGSVGSLFGVTDSGDPIDRKKAGETGYAETFSERLARKLRKNQQSISE